MQKSLVSVKMEDTLMATSACVVATSLAPTVKSTREQVSNTHHAVTLHAGATNDIHCLHTGPIPPVRCGQSYCLNGGKCLSLIADVCLCPPGYLGPHCDVCECQSVHACVNVWYTIRIT